MGRLVNEFSWSASRGRQFRECRRAYWFNYYGHWGGWERDADRRTRLIYTLKKMTNLDMWAGEIVHSIIHGVCQFASMVDGSGDRTAVEDGLAALRRGWQESKAGDWQANPKRHVNLFEHYYGVPVPQERTDAIKAKVTCCLKTFSASKLWQIIKAKPATAWLALEELDSFMLDGLKVYAKPDLAMQNGRITLYDWKTGKPRETDDDQLVGYALFALAKGWASSVDQIDLLDFYLSTGEVRRTVATAEQLADLTARIKAEAAAMKAMLAVPEQNEADEQDFPFTERLRACWHCQWRAVCEGARRPGATPDQSADERCRLGRPFGPEAAQAGAQ